MKVRSALVNTLVSVSCGSAHLSIALVTFSSANLASRSCSLFKASCISWMADRFSTVSSLALSSANSNTRLLYSLCCSKIAGKAYFELVWDRDLLDFGDEAADVEEIDRLTICRSAGELDLIRRVRRVLPMCNSSGTCNLLLLLLFQCVVSRCARSHREHLTRSRIRRLRPPRHRQ